MNGLRARTSMLIAAVGVLLVVLGALSMDPDTRSYISCLEMPSHLLSRCHEPAGALGSALVLGGGATLAFLGAGLALFRR